MANTWIFQGKPEIWDVPGGVNRLETFNWGVRQFEDEIHEGDDVFIWVSGRGAGIVALATVTCEPGYYSDRPEEIALYPGGPPLKFQGRQLRVYLRREKVMNRRITRSELREHPSLRDLSILAMPQATNFRVSADQAQELRAIADER
jgi:predicted RNA-binding protein with PUA-like domain